ncbi:hypothetical protein A2818_02670 [Candidatus Nomurabacteria bacterium RIFCSPHIGHO2_01_FULL_40_12]|uniref:PKD domain-containing protein n=1 Tax=Candidatus Nomurabacteria bacterium RIFCSPHIGHO2_01_FULL_40_12 TaxID=1801737 RepID=A0A1F6V1P5_9BACT|nr:MAG: hypothetical protein A2818_02670 [Candidatus Nomurabacteria bacterium RIFCSPHIGHO2_01_FULL_40_12]
MSKRIILFFIGLIFFSGFNLARADVVINEVQVLPTGEKFLELYNTGGSSVDLTDWQIKKKTESGLESTLVSKVRLEGKSIPAGGYFLIANETSYTGQGTLNASWPPSNTGVASNNTVLLYRNEELINRFGWGEASDCQNPCPPNPTTGQSLQKVSGSWVVALPTPGASNESSSSFTAPSGTGSLNNENSSTQTTATSQINNKTTEQPKIKTQITGKILAFVGMPIELEGNAFGYSGEKLYSGKYFWNFGDGDSREVKANDIGQFVHTYFYAGEYVVTLEYYLNHYGNVPDASDKMAVKVVPAEILISRVGDEKDFFVELSNNTDYNADLSKWFLLSNGKSFTIPRNTILEPKKKMIISSKLTSFSVEDKNTLKLMTPQGEIAFDYSASTIPAKVVIAKNKIPAQVSINQDKNKNLDEIQNLVPADNLGASVIESDVTTNNFNSYLLMIASVIFIGVSAGAVYFLRQKKTISNTGDDFKILDE